jgi:hypothetical protein
MKVRNTVPRHMGRELEGPMARREGLFRDLRPPRERT